MPQQQFGARGADPRPSRLWLAETTLRFVRQSQTAEVLNPALRPPNEMNRFSINAATETDVPLLLALIRELAEFEHLAHEVAVTAASLREALFGERPVATALLAVVDGRAVGYAVYYRTFSTFVGRAGVFLEDLYVQPAYRKRGLGRALLEEVAAVDAAAGGGRFEWIALRWNENAFRFYRSLGAKVMEEWALLRMNGKEVSNLVSAKVKVGA